MSELGSPDLIHCRLVVDVALRHWHDFMRRGAPTVVGDEELAFDFDRHGKGRDSGFEASLPSAAPALPNPQSRIPNPGLPGSTLAIDSPCAVFGNMSIPPAARNLQARNRAWKGQRGRVRM